MVSDENQKLTLTLMAAVAAAVIGGSFQYGYNIAVVNAPATLIKEYFFGDEVAEAAAEISVTQDVVVTEKIESLNSTSENQVVFEEVEKEYSSYETFLWSLTVSIFNVGGMLGSYLTGFFIGKLGRKGAMLVNNSFSIVGAILMATSKVANSIEMIMVARFLLGVFAGLATGVVPLYLTEISPQKYRGAIGVANQLLITIGILIAQILSLNEILGTPDLWPLLLAFTVVPTVFQLIVLPFLPESPRCLLIDKNEEEKATEALSKFRGTADVSKEIREMQMEAQSESADEQLSIMELFRDATVRWQLISIIVLHICQQLCGINAIFFYLNTILEAAGVPKSWLNYAAVIVGSVNVIMTVVSVFLMDRTGRKNLLGVGYIIAGVFCILMTISLNLQDVVPGMSYLSIVCVVGFIIGFAIGPGPVPWILNTEFFRQSARPSASAIGCGFNWTFNFLLALVFPFLQKAMGAYVFIFFLAVCIFAAAYVFIVVPETKNKSFQQINLMFAKRNKLKKDDLVLMEETTEMMKK